MNSIGWIEHTVQDLRHALRQLARSPAFAGIVVVTLALGIGSTTAIFSVVEAVLLRPLPYPEADRLVRIIERPAEQVNDVGYQQSLAAIWTRDLPVLRAQVPTLSHIGVYSAVTATVVVDPDNPLRLEGNRLSPAVFEMLGARPALGRIFLPDGRSAFDRASRRPQLFDVAAVLRWAGRRPRTQPRRGRHGGFTIVGVMPQAFQFPDAQSMFWLPYTLDGRMQRLAPIARLADDVTIEVASANVEAVLQQIRKTEPRVPGPASTSGVSRFEVRTIQEHLVAPVRPSDRGARVGSGICAAHRLRERDELAAQQKRCPSPGAGIAGCAWCQPGQGRALCADGNPAPGDARWSGRGAVGVRHRVSCCARSAPVSPAAT